MSYFLNRIWHDRSGAEFVEHRPGYVRRVKNHADIEYCIVDYIAALRIWKSGTYVIEEEPG
jgi:hypothetical protein